MSKKFPFIVKLPKDLVMGIQSTKLAIKYATWLDENIAFDDFILPHNDEDYATTIAFKNKGDAVLFRLWMEEL